ncbi:type I polyketide synthase [Flavitalea sp. BT771]|uniref:type I polyketide synthase n=1 Tax=Flavitalea sp. BT771 TaxID=3063329 RepID=UPI0026E20918|nr:type I polyketide synthase [Flavitalea sp. BT771]MDO6434614.1 type I polyketide synthase [Flavitalea sp. BT771]MDV6223514.1 type I polyketide synthase [Flavitalea sp. BT771]
MKNNTNYTGLEIAVIGMACRFPGAMCWRDFWNNLENAVESIHFLSEEELIALGVDERTRKNKRFVNAVTLLPDKDRFDAAFFDYRPIEASLMNPLHRIFHECTWEALEDAAYDPERVKGAIGLFAGGGDDSNWRLYSRLKNNKQEIDDFNLFNLSNKDFLASLLSYKLNLRGPSYSINTTCSTSLVAISLACKSLLLGETRIALAGGVSVKTHRKKGYFYEEGMIFSADGHCRAFDKEATGTLVSEGAGVVVLKKLTDAIEDRDHIYAVIKGSAINNDGSRKVGFTASSVEGQTECIRKAHKFARTTPDTISYVETHGTGTRLGDPVEIEALNTAFNRNQKQHCAIGSVKTNIGHLDTAAGVAGFMKLALSLKYKRLPASLNFSVPNPEIDFNQGPFYVNTRLREWTAQGDGPLRGAVSSFGIGGTNVHAILEEAPVHDNASPGRPYHLLTLSARTDTALLRYHAKLKDFLSANPGLHAPDIAYTFQVGRREFVYRAPLVYKDTGELLHLLEKGLTPQQARKSTEKTGPLVFLFPGQGSQYQHMGKDLYDSEPVFRREMDNGFTLIRQLTGMDYRQIIYPPADGPGPAKINDTRYTQPLVFLLEYSLARLLMSFGLLPGCMIGHSIGEYVAACIGGLISFEDALRLVVRRGELIGGLPPGAMISLALSPGEAADYLDERISLAAVNGNEQTVLSGDPDAIASLMHRLDYENKSYVKLHTSHAFHSSMLDAIIPSFRIELEKVSFGQLHTPFISNLTGKFIQQQEAASPDYWVRHMRQTVLFAEGIHTLLDHDPKLTFLEVGAGHTLTHLVKQIKQDNPLGLSVNMMRSPKEKIDDNRYLAERIGDLWAHGFPVDWTLYHKDEKRNRISLPTYPFEPARYPAEVDPFGDAMPPVPGLTNSGDNNELKDWIYYPSWKQEVQLPPAPLKEEKGYLLFCPDEDCMLPLRKKLGADTENLVVIMPGAGFRKLSRFKYQLDFTAADDLHALVGEVEKDGLVMADIIYAWGMSASPCLELSEANPALHLAFFSLVRLIQALAQKKQLAGRRLFILTDSLYKVLGTEKGLPIQSLLLGLANVIPQEYAVSCRHIDLQGEWNSFDTSRMLADEIRSRDERRPRIMALRNGRRWIQEHQKNTQPMVRQQEVLRKGGTYLITGGLGNLGYLLAKFLVEQYEARLVLVGRKEEQEQAAGSEWTRRLDTLRSMASVLYYSADVSLPDKLETVVRQAEEAFGQIHGVVHAAGIIDGRYFELLEDISMEKALGMFGPKIRGIAALHKVFAPRLPDFVWVASSISSVLGGLGFSSYSSANLFMDHFVCSVSDDLPYWKSINLAEMAFTDSDAARDSGALLPAEIIALFEWSLGIKGQPLILETTWDLAMRKYEVFEVKKEIYLDGETAAGPTTIQQRPDLAVDFIPPVTRTEEMLKNVFEQFFGMNGIGVADDFFELGGDSLKGMLLLKRIKKEFNVNLTIKDFLQHPSIRGIASAIEGLQWLQADVKMENEITI